MKYFEHDGSRMLNYGDKKLYHVDLSEKDIRTLEKVFPHHTSITQTKNDIRGALNNEQDPPNQAGKEFGERVLEALDSAVLSGWKLKLQPKTTPLENLGSKLSRTFKLQQHNAAKKATIAKNNKGKIEA